MKKYAIILAAGLGVRMKSELPKCATLLLDKPMIEYIVDELTLVGFDEIICVIGHKADVIKSILKNRVTYVVQSEQLGTANAVLQAIPFLNDGISLIIPGDVPLIDNKIISSIIDNHYNNGLTVATITVDDPTGYGRIINDNNILRIVEEKEANENELLIKEVNSGVMCIDNFLLKKYITKINDDNYKREYYLTDIVFLLNKYNVKSFNIKDVFKLSGVNDLIALNMVEEYLINDIINKHLNNGVRIMNRKSVVISKDTIIDENVIIKPNTILLGNNIIGKNCIIGPNSHIVNSIVKDNVNIESSTIKDSIINNNTIIGPYAHIKQNSEIGENNRIGNYVEIKNTKTNNNVKAVHLSYIGDAIIGSNVNFGCGSITVNYDGKVKSKTNIEDNVFIGCNSNLIAPIKINSNSYIAAGTTVTDDVASGDLVIGRVKQENKKGYIVK